MAIENAVDTDISILYVETLILGLMVGVPVTVPFVRLVLRKADAYGKQQESQEVIQSTEEPHKIFKVICAWSGLGLNLFACKAVSHQSTMYPFLDHLACANSPCFEVPFRTRAPLSILTHHTCTIQSSFHFIQATNCVYTGRALTFGHNVHLSSLSNINLISSTNLCHRHGQL